MSSPKDVGLRLAALSALRDLIDGEITNARADMSQALLDVQAATGADRIVITLPGDEGGKVGSVSLVKDGGPSVEIDPAAFLAWCQENAEDEVVYAVREPYRRALMARLVVDGGDVIDPTTGMVCDFARPRPVAESSGRFTLRFEGGTNGVGRELIASAWRRGQLHLTGAMGITGGAH